MSPANIGPRECAKRLAFGVAMSAGGAAAGTALLFFNAGRAWRLLLFFPFWLAALGLLQARGKT